MKKQNIQSLSAIANVEVLKAFQQDQILGGKSKATEQQDYIIIEENPAI